MYICKIYVKYIHVNQPNLPIIMGTSSLQNLHIFHGNPNLQLSKSCHYVPLFRTAAVLVPGRPQSRCGRRGPPVKDHQSGVRWRVTQRWWDMKKDEHMWKYVYSTNELRDDISVQSGQNAKLNLRKWDWHGFDQETCCWFFDLWWIIGDALGTFRKRSSSLKLTARIWKLGICFWLVSFEMVSWQETKLLRALDFQGFYYESWRSASGVDQMRPMT